MNTCSVDDFSDLDDLDSAPTKPESAARQAQRAAAPMITCPRCRGTKVVTFGYSNVRTGQCFCCKGTGQVRADWEKRREAFKKGERTKETNRVAKMQDWQRDNAARWAWIERAASRDFGFAVAMADAVKQYGALTEKQLATVDRLMVQDAERSAARNQEAKAREVAVVGTNGIIEALTKATRTGHKAPKLRTAAATFSLAKPNSKNAGCVYVVDGADTYLGKITPEGIFQPSRDCNEETRASVATTAADALSAAVEYGKKTGRCSCCGRELTDPVSIAKGIGPVCESGFF